jgi:hypothetical protein
MKTLWATIVVGVGGHGPYEVHISPPLLCYCDFSKQYIVDFWLNLEVFSNVKFSSSSTTNPNLQINILYALHDANFLRMDCRLETEDYTDGVGIHWTFDSKFDAGG